MRHDRRPARWSGVASATLLGMTQCIATIAVAGRASAATTSWPPPIEGHVTDPDRRLGDAAERSLERVFAGIQEDAKVDVAALITHAPTNEVEPLGHAAYVGWGVGREWDAGILIVLSTDGHVCKVIVEGEPVLSPSDTSQVEAVAADLAAAGDFEGALRSAGDMLGALLRQRARSPIARPPGAHDWHRSLLFGASALLMVLGVGIQTLRGRRAWSRA